MPRITEPTVAEHRAKQRAAILRAAEDLALERGGAAVTVASVAGRTGLARPSVYAYFSSAEDILATLVVDGFERWHRTLQETTRETDSPEDLVRLYFAAAATSAAQGNHRLAAALAGVRLPEAVRASLMRGHQDTARPLLDAARSLGVPDDRDEQVGALLMALVNHCIARVEAGHDAAREADLAAVMAVGGIQRLAHGPR
ncbi:TetR/AcrR family transcriptional regulator [Actinotalea subterranea]|uniref:TetR/AcrR family transcriptional regulator n=1 Tax=Actinotalea subterranea TaxID=2607497 RepID=UPI0011EF2CC8|nr:TetR/AcrR family transcriptional regulator [Actinotalea subterranea]